MRHLILLLLFISVFGASCRKYLAEKPDKQLVLPTDLSNLQALLDNAYLMNQQSPSSMIAAADEYYLTADQYNSQPDYAQQLYQWNMDFPINYNNGNDWSFNYDAVYNCNVVLESLTGIARTPSNAALWDNVKGSALAFRANCFMQLAWMYAKGYDSLTAVSEPGIVLRTASDFNVPSVRATLANTYVQILTDLHVALPLLPNRPLFSTRPSKTAALALLARLHLSMHQYDSVYDYADQCLALQHDLMNFNSVDLSAQQPFAPYNSEVIWHFAVGVAVYYGILPFYSQTDTTLFQSYAADDLRRVGYFDTSSGNAAFKGTYGPNFFTFFSGPAVDEAYLMRAEAAARTGRTAAALTDLNTLEATRRVTNTFVPVTETNPQLLLSLILAERRKELLFRDLRWMDIKRLNQEGAGITLTHIVNGKVYTLPPNDPRFALPIPSDIIRQTGMPQNQYH